MISRTQRGGLRAWVALLLVLAIGSLGNTCVVVEEGPGDTAYRDESAEEQMQEEEIDELDRETGF